MSSTSPADNADHRVGHIRSGRSKLVAPVVVVIATIGAIAAVWTLVERANSSRVAQLDVSAISLTLADLQSAPFDADPAEGGAGGSPQLSQARIQRDEYAISSGLTVGAVAGAPVNLLYSARADLAGVETLVSTVYKLAAHKGGLVAAGAPVVLPLGRMMIVRSAALTGVLTAISRLDATRAESARRQSEFGSAIAMLLLLAAFAYFYWRSVSAHESVERLAGEKETLLGVSRREARTDALTSLRNRRALTNDLARGISELSDSEELLLVMFDLDGFKQYNDTFGHPAGDALLQRLGGRLNVAAAKHGGSAYRMGGDEFCVLVRWSSADAEQLLHETISALEDGGEAWHIGCSYGVSWIPSEADTQGEALKLADDRLYANKASRSLASRQVTDALLQVLTEQGVSLDEHVERVSESAGALATALGLPEPEVQRIRLAARLHDIGKTAIPAAILDKPGPLDEREGEFVHRHPAIGARIVAAAPVLARTAPLIRSSHERIDGHGYPDGLVGEDIPLGSRIIAVADAFDAMTSDRLYEPAISVDAALKELKQNAGTQFDATIVAAFCRNIDAGRALQGA